MENKEEQKAIGLAIKRLDNLIVRSIQARLAKEGFDECTIMHGWIMGYLYDHRDDRICQKDLEEKFGIAKSTVTNILKLMEKKGYIVRISDEKDGRAKILELTESGIALHRRIVEVIDRFHEEMEQGISTKEKEALYNTIQKIVNNLEVKETDR